MCDWCNGCMQIKCKWKSCVSEFNMYLQNTGASSAHKRSNRHVYIGRTLLITIEALFISAQRNQLAQNFQIFIILFLTHYRHIGYRLVVCLFVFLVLNFLQNNIQTHGHSNMQISLFFLLIYLFRLVLTCCVGFFWLSACPAFVCIIKCLCDVFMRCYLLFDWMLNMTHEDNIWNCFRFPITTLTLCFVVYLCLCKNWTIGQLHCTHTHNFCTFCQQNETGRSICKQMKQNSNIHSLLFLHKFSTIFSHLQHPKIINKINSVVYCFSSLFYVYFSLSFVSLYSANCIVIVNVFVCECECMCLLLWVHFLFWFYGRFTSVRFIYIRMYVCLFQILLFVLFSLSFSLTCFDRFMNFQLILSLFQ